MESLDAQCLLLQVAEGEVRSPDLWLHHRSGRLSCAYEGSERVFEWPSEAVAEMARRWRDSDAGPSEEARHLLEAHERLETLAGEAGLGPADVMIHDLGRREIRGIWRDEKIVLVIDEIPSG